MILYYKGLCEIENYFIYNIFLDIYMNKQYYVSDK